MTEREWLSSSQPREMLFALRELVNLKSSRFARKVRLFGCGLLSPHLAVTAGKSGKSNAVEVAERFADKQANAAELKAAYDGGVAWPFQLWVPCFAGSLAATGHCHVTPAKHANPVVTASRNQPFNQGFIHADRHSASRRQEAAIGAIGTSMLMQALPVRRIEGVGCCQFACLRRGSRLFSVLAHERRRHGTHSACGRCPNY